ncbi:MAG: AAA family ATPase [Cytophagales bacterium]|nr:AAA family ATPase [Cytophagales bacterium]
MRPIEEKSDEYNGVLEFGLARIRATSVDLVRPFIDIIDWDERLIAVMGPRGCGKTTLLLQYIKLHPEIAKTAAYISLDNLYFHKHNLIDFASRFVKYGGKHLFIDEVHKYPTWSVEIKNIYDIYPGLKIVITGSSILDIYKGYADLSRRAVRYIMHGLSFREFIWFDRDIKLPSYSLIKILKDHVAIASDITSKLLILPAFRDYLTYGYYPYFKESKKSYAAKLANTINLMLETDMPAVHNMEYAGTYKLKKMLAMIADFGPFKPDISKLAALLEINRNYTLTYLHYLADAQLLSLLKTDENKESILAKPEKVYLNNTNIAYALGSVSHNIVAFREIFFFNQLYSVHSISYTEMGDFMVDNTYVFEVGGKNKKFAQIKDLPSSYVAADETEIGFGNRIPLWLFGFIG